MIEKFLIFCSPLESDISNIIKYENFFKSFITNFDIFVNLSSDIQILLINCIENTIFNLRLKGEQTGGLVSIFDNFLEKILKNEKLSKKVEILLISSKQKIFQIKTLKKINYLALNENSISLNEYIEKQIENNEIEKIDLEIKNNNIENEKNNDEKAEELMEIQVKFL